MIETPGLRDAIASLAALPLDGTDLDSVLLRVAECTARAVPGADGVVVGLASAAHSDVPAASTGFAGDVDSDVSKRDKLSFPLVAPHDETPIGTMTVYARLGDVFDGHAASVARTFVGYAAVTVHNAIVVARSKRSVDHLRESLSSRAIVDQAIGIIMSRTGGVADDAFAVLRTLSQKENKKVVDVARHLVEEARRRARARVASATMLHGREATSAGMGDR